MGSEWRGWVAECRRQTVPLQVHVVGWLPLPAAFTSRAATRSLSRTHTPACCLSNLALMHLQAGLPVSIASPDKDFLQLLRPGLVLLKMPTATLGRAKYQAPPYTHSDFEQAS